MALPWLVNATYIFLFWYGLILIVGALVYFFILFTSISENYFWGSVGNFIWRTLAGGIAWGYWLFDRYYPNEPERIPLGVRLWAQFSRRALFDHHDGLVNTDTLAERAKRASGHAWNAAKAKAETHRAKVDAYEMELAKQHEEAQADLQRKARDYNEAKERAEEAKRRRDSGGRA